MVPKAEVRISKLSCPYISKYIQPFIHNLFITLAIMNPESIRKESLELWEAYFKDAWRQSKYDQEFRSFLDNLRRDEEDKAEAALQPWLQIFEDSLQWLSNIWGILSVRMNEEEKDRRELALSAWSLISSSCNYAVAIRLMVISGLDNPARTMARSLDEHLSACIAILHKPELAVGFQSAQEHEEASQFWYDNFNSKKLRKHLNSVERTVGIAPHVSRAFREYRDNELNYFSQTIHPTFLSGVMAANTIEVNNTGDLVFGLYGRLSACSERTLNHACKSIWYFSRFGFSMFFNEIDGSEPLIVLDKEDELHQMAVIGRDVINSLNLKYWEYTKYPASVNS